MTQLPVRRSRLGCGIVLGVVGVIAVIVIVAAAGSSGAKSGALPAIGSDSTAKADVAVSGCSVTTEFGTSFSHATIKITNPTDQTQSYTATISVNDATGARISEINTVSNSLGAHQSVTLSGPEATGNVTGGTVKGPLTCSVASVNRFPS